jgi:hypothetical protein
MAVRLFFSEPPKAQSEGSHSKPFNKPLGHKADPVGGKVYDKGFA